MKTLYWVAILAWVIPLGIYSGVVGNAEYSRQTTFIWGGEAINVTTHGDFTEFSLKDPLYLNTETNQVMKLNGTLNANPLEFRFSEGQVVDYNQVYDPSYFPFLYERQQKVWNEYTVDGQLVFTDKIGFNPLIFVFGLWGITGSLMGAKVFQEKRSK